MKSINEQNDKTMKKYMKPVVAIVETDLSGGIAQNAFQSPGDEQGAKSNAWDAGYDSNTDTEW